MLHNQQSYLAQRASCMIKKNSCGLRTEPWGIPNELVTIQRSNHLLEAIGQIISQSTFQEWPCYPNKVNHARHVRGGWFPGVSGNHCWNCQQQAKSRPVCRCYSGANKINTSTLHYYSVRSKGEGYCFYTKVAIDLYSVELVKYSNRAVTYIVILYNNIRCLV